MSVDASKRTVLSSAPLRAVVGVSDLEKSKRFYGETLGLTQVEERADGIQFEAGDGTRVLLYPTQFAGTAKSTVAGFEVAHIDTAVAELRERGVVFEEYDFPGLKTTNGIAEVGDIRGGWFKDPDGNILGVAEHR